MSYISTSIKESNRMSQTYAPTIGGIFKRAFHLLGPHFVSTLLMFFFIITVSQFADYILANILAQSQQDIHMNLGATSITGDDTMGMYYSFFSFLLNAIFFTSATMFIFLKLLGPHMSGIKQQSLSTGQAIYNIFTLRTVVFYFLSLTYMLFIFVGSLMLLIPGIIIWCTYSLLQTAYVAEGASFTGAYRISRKLTSGHFWKIFTIELLTVAIYFLSVFLLTFAHLILINILGLDPHPLVHGLPVGAGVALSTVIVTALHVSMYLTLREHKEMAELEQQVEQIETSANPEGFVFDVADTAEAAHPQKLPAPNNTVESEDNSTTAPQPTNPLPESES